MSEQHKTSCDIAIIGASLGGHAAADPAAMLFEVSDDAPYRVIVTEETDWRGGQVSSQGVSALDEHAYIETFGCTEQYAEFRRDLRHRYEHFEKAPSRMAESVLGPDMPLNPGNGWVSRLCFTPKRGHDVLSDPVSVTPHWRHEVISAEVVDGMVKHVVVRDADGKQTVVAAQYYLDATDLGDLLPLTNTAYVTGAEAQADTGEPHAAAEARPNETQGFTYCLAVEYCAGEDHTIAKPDGYEWFRDNQPYTLSPIGRDGKPVVYKMFENSEQGNLPFWTYRRIHDGALLGGNDISLINWVSNDYHGGNIIDASPEDKGRYLDEAKRLSLGFLYWLQTECPRDDGGFGYPEFKLRPDIMGTEDGLSKQPYIRESRRIVPLQRVVEQAITAEFNAGARARHFSDSVGIGWYAMDLHPCVGNPTVSMYAPTKPFQIPLGALIPRDTKNLIAACKNIGTTHLTNGAYRLHPIEWAIGEAAGTLAAFCIANDLTPHEVHADAWQVWRLQYQLLSWGCPLVWAVDVPLEHDLFLPTQLLLVRDLIVADSPRWHSLEIGLDQPLADSINIDRLHAIADEINTHLHQKMIDPKQLSRDKTWAAVCILFDAPLRQSLS